MNRSMYNLRVFVEPLGVDVRPCALTHGFGATSKCRYPGVYAEISDLMRDDVAKSMNITAVFAPENTVEPLEYVTQMMQNGSIDTAAVCFSRTSAREKIYKFNQVSMYSNHVFALAADHETTTSPLDGFIKFISVFQPSLWLAIGLLWITVYAYRHYGPKVEKSLEWRNKVFLILVTLLSMFSLGLYAKVVLSRLVVPHHRPLFEDAATLAEAVRSGKAELVLYKGGALMDRLEKAAEQAKLDKTTNFSPITRLALAINKTASDSIEPFMNPWFPAEKIQTKLDNNFVFIDLHSYIGTLGQRICHWRVVKLEDLGAFDCWWMFGKHTPDWVIKNVDTAMLKHIDWLEPITIRYRQRSEYAMKMATQGCPIQTESRFVFSYPEFLGASVILLMGFGAANIGLAGELIATVIKKWKNNGRNE